MNKEKQQTDDFTAVFNCREEELKKAKKQYIKVMGEKSFNKVIQPYIDKGIMSIFEDNPTKETAYYVVTLSYYVRQRLDK